MKIADNASIDDNTHGGGEIPPRTGLIPDALPEVQEPVLAENSQTGVSTRNALSVTDGKTSLKTIKRKPIGMPSVLPMDAKRRHTITWLESM